MDRTVFNLLEVETFLNSIGVETRNEEDDSFRKFNDVLYTLINVWDMTDKETKKDIVNKLLIN